MRNSICSLATLAFCLLSTVLCLPSYDIESLVRPNTPENLERLRHLGKDDLAEELSGQYQGDIIITPEQQRQFGRGRTGLLDLDYRWADNTIPYWINESYFDASQIEYIHIGAQKLEEVTCLKFVPYDASKHTDYITVQGENSGCWSYVGRIGGRQFLNLQSYDREVGCFRLYTIVHEFLHALGFFHMQSSTERDEYVEIVWDKIQSGTASNFNKYGADIITNYDVEYDYGSVMHYGPTAFTIDGSQTIIPLKDLEGETMGQRLRLSEKDIARTNRMYCDEPAVETTKRPVNPNKPTFREIFYSLKTFLNNLFGQIFGRIGM